MLNAATRAMRLTTAVILVVLAVCVWPAVLGGGSASTRASKWVAARRAQLPSQFEEVRLYPTTYQQAIYAALTAEAKLTLWREYLALAADTVPTLTAAQRAFLRRFSNTIVTEDFQVFRMESQRTLALMSQVKTVLGKHADLISQDAWGRLPMKPSPFRVGLLRTVDALRLHVAEYVVGLVTTSAALPDCNCWVEGQGVYDCPSLPGYDKYCRPNPPTPICQVIIPGGELAAGKQLCGLFRDKPCNGTCSYVPSDPCFGDPQYLKCTCESNGGTWNFDINQCTSASPILINMRSNSAVDHLTSAADGVLFDINADGIPDQVAWTEANSDVGFLVLDRNSNGLIDGGSELFGTATRKRDGTLPANGFEALLDLDGGPGISDGKVTSADPIYARLRLWVDGNHNGISEPRELRRLEEARITTIFTAYWETRRRDRYGNAYRFEGTALLINNGGQEVQRRIFDVFLMTK